MHFSVSEEVLHYSNYDLDNVVTPVNADVFERLLTETKYDTNETRYLINGFKNGFQLEYLGDRMVKKNAPNLKLRVGNPVQLWNKVMLEVRKGRYAGPYKEIPFDNYIQSPIGLVPKDKGTKTRLIFHLSYPKTGVSVNSEIPKEKTSVHYPEFDIAVRMCLEAGAGCYIGKSDMSAAFRQIGMAKSDWPLLVMKAVNPDDGVTYYFVDKCLPFGSAISCAIFQRFSNAVAHIVRSRVHKKPLNYLDDFFFAALRKCLCDHQLQVFLNVCEEINFPVALEKTYWGTTMLTFLGLLLDTEKQLVCIPCEKIVRALELVDSFLSRKTRKVKVLEVQKLCGFLNFLCRCVIPGRVFLRRLYSLTNKVTLKPHHHIKLSVENILDLCMWRNFLMFPQVFYRPFVDFKTVSSEDIDMYSDASGTIGFGAYCGTEWTFGAWDKSFLAEQNPSIEFLELFALTVGVLNWIWLFKNKKVALFCDNEAAVAMVNSSVSKCKRCMVLLRIITLEGLIHNVKISAKYVNTKANGKSDALSRLDFDRFWKLAPYMNDMPSQIPQEVWPIEKIWFA